MTGNRNNFCSIVGSQIKTRPKFEGETAKLYGVCFDCSNGNHVKRYSQGMRKVAEFFRRTATYVTDIHYMVMNGTQKVLTRPVKVSKGYDEVDNMLLRKELLDLAHGTSKG